YFYNLNGRRLAEALTTLGFAVDVTTLRDCPQREYDWCILVNITEVLHAYGSTDEGLEQIKAVRRRCPRAGAASPGSVQTPWFGRLLELRAAAGVHDVVDLGLYNQVDRLPAQIRRGYHFVFSGLTPSE